MPLSTIPIMDETGELDRIIFVQGGMGARISTAQLAAAVARRGAIGTISHVALDEEASAWLGRRVGHREAARLEVEKAKKLSEGRGQIAINIMRALEGSYEESIRGAIEGGVDVIFMGAGLPLSLPEIVRKTMEESTVPLTKPALVPIVSSCRAAMVIEKHWERYKCVPDGVVLEGPLAGGHLGFKLEDLEKPEYQLEAIFPPLRDFAAGRYPVIVAGGIFYRSDIFRWKKLGANGVQLATRFAVTRESNGSDDFKRALLTVKKEDIVVTKKSPAGLPFRVDSRCLGHKQACDGSRTPSCTLGYLLQGGVCSAKTNPKDYCLCESLTTAVDPNNREKTGAEAIFTLGRRADQFAKNKMGIVSVDDLMEELTGLPLLR
jgi:nitronate monooxygenase